MKALDDTFGGYADLGWGDDLRLYSGYGNTANLTPPSKTSPTPTRTASPVTASGGRPSRSLWPPGLREHGTTVLQGGLPSPTKATMPHEGRIPLQPADFRVDFQYPSLTFVAGRRTSAMTIPA